ncbi:hypothetical protein LRS10_13965 [Phenylobacterium sp. J426]|uniref:hypothetical protein n=1 Tax=Phenylobacterium sp. J426 TaxID=2898439 RepID=UPI002151DD94|nr:hypothetical protein [Phenylobacterium sp. J426]MCR5875198.1 hypothetical protein [Phenylobacterium sp. J426]
MLAASLLLVQGAPAAANTDTAEKDPVICKNEAAAGSRLPKKVCATKSEWERRKQEDRDNLEKSQRNRPMLGQ